MTTKFSDCCGAEPRSIGNGDNDTEDFGICPSCKEHCEYVEYCDDCGEQINECTCDENSPDNLIAQNALWQIENNAEDK